MKRTSHSYLRGFDGLRAIAVSLVLAAHSGAWERYKGIEWFDRYAYPLVMGENGVLIFFALSGFLITHLLLREKKRNGRINYRFFLLRRLLRLLPAFGLFWVILLLLTVLGYYDIPPASFAFAAVYLYNFIPRHFYSGYFGLTWSLGVEEQFYLLWPLVVQRIPLPSLRQGITGTALAFISISLVFMWVVPAAHLPAIEVELAHETVNLGEYTLGEAFFPYRWFIPMGSYLLLGCVAAAWAETIPSWLCQAYWPWLLAILLYLAPWYVSQLGYLPQKLLQTSGISLLLLGLYHQQKSWLTKLLEAPPLRHLGKVSYGLYLYSGIYLATGISTPAYWWQTQPWALLLTYLTAAGSFFTLEQYFLAKKVRYRA